MLDCTAEDIHSSTVVTSVAYCKSEYVISVRKWVEASSVLCDILSLNNLTS